MEEQKNTLDREAMAELLRSLPEGEELLLQVTGWSMMPMLFHGRSTVTLVRERAYTPKKGDVVLFRRPTGEFVLHRVCKVEPSGLLLINGDAQSWTERILPVQVVAKVTGFYRRRREISVGNRGYRIYCALWCPLRPLHPLGAKAVYFWHRVPEKLFSKKHT